MARPLILDAVRHRSALLFDLAIDLIVPPLSVLAVAVLLGCAASLVAASRALVAWLAAAVCLVVYVVRGWALSGIGLKGLSALARAPFYVLWKVSVLARRAGTSEWVRTPREDAIA